MSQIPDFLSSAASEAQSFHGLLHSLDNGGSVQDEPGDDNMVVPDAIVDRLLRGVKGEAINTVAQVFDVREARYVGVLHNGRFCEIDAHPGGSLCSYECSPLRERSKHNWSDQSNHIHCNNSSCDSYVRQLTTASLDGFQFVKIATNKGESDAKSAHHAAFEKLDLIFGRRRHEAVKGAEHQPPHNETDTAPGESAADEISPLITTKDTPHSATVAQ